jgi:hypothetical protein
MSTICFSSSSHSSQSVEDIFPGNIMEAMACRLRGNDPTLTEVNLAWPTLAASHQHHHTAFFYETLTEVADCVATNSHLTTLRLTLSPQSEYRQQQQHDEDTTTSSSSGNSVSSHGSGKSSNSLSSSSSTTTSSTTVTDLKSRLLLTLALRLRDNSHLETLAINAQSSSCLDPLYLLIHDLPLMPKLCHLSLIRCGMGRLQAQALGRALARASPTLQSLDVSENRLDQEAAKPIFNSLMLFAGNLQTLLMNQNPFEAQVVEDVARVLELNTSLQRLSFHSSIPSNFILSPALATRFGDAMAHNHTLLHLSTNMVDGRPPYLVAQGLAQNTTLLSLSWPCTEQELVLSRLISTRTSSLSRPHVAQLQELSIRTSCATLRTVARSLGSKNKSSTGSCGCALRKLTLLEPDATSQDPEPAREVSKAVTRFVEAMSHNVRVRQLSWTPGVVLALEPKEFKERYVPCGIIVQAIEAKLQLAAFYAQLNHCGRGVWHTTTTTSSSSSTSIQTAIAALLPTVILRAENNPKLIFALLQEAIAVNTAAAVTAQQKMVRSSTSKRRRRRWSHP